jgi:hypothetical protein
VTIAGGNKLDGLWFETWSRIFRHGVVDMTIYIHALKETRTKLEPSGKKGTFVGYKESHMDVDSEEQEDTKDDHVDPSTPIVHPSDYQEELVKPAELVDLLRDVAVTKYKLAWLRDTLQDAERHLAPCGTFKEKKRPQIFSSYIESKLSRGSGGSASGEAGGPTKYQLRRSQSSKGVNP